MGVDGSSWKIVQSSVGASVDASVDDSVQPPWTLPLPPSVETSSACMEAPIALAFPLLPWTFMKDPISVIYLHRSFMYAYILPSTSMETSTYLRLLPWRLSSTTFKIYYNAVDPLYPRGILLLAIAWNCIKQLNHGWWTHLWNNRGVHFIVTWIHHKSCHGPDASWWVPILVAPPSFQKAHLQVRKLENVVLVMPEKRVEGGKRRAASRIIYTKYNNMFEANDETAYYHAAVYPVLAC